MTAIIMYTTTIGFRTGRSPGPGIRGCGVLLLTAPGPSNKALTTVEAIRVALKCPMMIGIFCGVNVHVVGSNGQWEVGLERNHEWA